MTELDRIYEDIENLLNEAQKIIIDLNDKNTFTSYVNKAIDSSANQQMQIDKNVDWGRYFNKSNATGYTFRNTLATSLYNSFTKKRNDEAQANGTQPNMTVTYSEIFQAVKPEVKKVADTNREKLQSNPEYQKNPEALQGEVLDYKDTPKGKAELAAKQANKDLANSTSTALNTNNQLNYRLKSVIDSPQIQQQIDAAPSAISYIGLENGNIVAMAENKVSSDFNIPSFLKKLMEANQISAIGAGEQQNLNVFLTPEIQNYLKTKGNPTITRVYLGNDGMVWLMDDNFNPIRLDDIGVNNDVATKGQESNSFNVFINNGGAGNNGNGGNGQNTDTNGDGTGNGGDEPSGEATGIVSRAELLAIKNTMAERVKNAVSSIKLDEVNNALKEYNTQINFTQLQLSKPLDGTYINDNSDWQSFTIKEANENGAQEQKAEKKEETTPQQTTNGDPENYIIGKFTLTPIEEENKTQQGENQGEAPTTPESNGEEPVKEESNKRNNWEDVLREAQELLKRIREDGDPEAEENADDTAQENEAAKKAEEEAKKKEEEKNQVLQKCFTLSLVKASEAVADALGTIKLQRKTNDQTTFTGRKTEETVFSFTPGQQKNFGWKKLDDKTFKCWFSVMIIKNGTTDTAGTKFNRVMNKVAGVANAVNKLNAGVSYDKV